MRSAASGGGAVGAAAGSAAKPPKKPRPFHVAALKQADQQAKRQRKIDAAKAARAQRTKPYNAITKRAQPASKQAKPLTKNEQLQIAVDQALARSGVQQHIKSSGIAGHLRAPSLLTRGGTQFGSDLLYAGPGVAKAAYGVGQDVRAALPKTHGGPGFKHTRAAGAGVVKQTYQDVRHPRKNIGHLGFDIAAALASGGGTVTRGGAFARTLRAGEGLRRATTKAGHEGGSLLHAPEPGVAKVTKGGLTEQFPLSRNAAYRNLVQKPYYRNLQRKVTERHGTVRTEPLGSKHPSEILSPEAKLGRAERVRRRLEQSQVRGNLNYVHRLGKRLNRDEHAALRVAAIEGDRALHEPVATIERHIRTHEAHMAAEGADKVAHGRIIQDLAAAEKVLRNPSQKFLDALEATRQLSITGEHESITRGFLDPTTAKARVARIAAEYRPGDIIEGPHGSVGVRTPGKDNLYMLEREHRQTRTVLAGEQRKLTTLEARLRKPPKSGKMRARPALKQKVERQRAIVDRWSKDTAAAEKRLNELGPQIKEVKPPSGAFYFHAGLGTAKPKQLGRVAEPLPSQYGMGPVQIGRYAPEMRRQFRGAGIRKGAVPLDIPKAVTQGYQRRLIAHSAHDFYGRLEQASTPRKMSQYDIPLRAGSKISDDLKKYFQTIEENIHLDPETLKGLTREQGNQLASELSAVEHMHAGLAPGASLPGVRWVDRRLLKDLGQTSMRGWFEKTADAVTNPIRFGTLYLRPAYALNLLGNAGMIAPEGAKAVSAVGRAVRMPRRIGEANTSWADGAMGSGKALGQQVGTGFMSRGTHAIAEGWNKGTDLHARRAALEVEMRNAGFKSKADWDRARTSTDPKVRGKVNEAIQRARSIIGDYENLTPVEKNQVRRVLYFYPWTKVATKWLGHTLTEHPIKTAAAAHLGQQVHENVQQRLGAMPAWAKQTGLLPVGGQQGGLQRVINPSSINTPSTFSQTGAAGLNAARGIAGLPQAPGAGLKDLLTPAFESFVTGAQPGTPGQPTGVLGAAMSTPIPSALKRLGVIGKPSKTYPETGVGPAVGPLVAGGLYPRKASLDALHKTAEKELRATMGKDQRTAHDFEQWRTKADKILKRHGVTMPKKYEARLDLWHERTAARRRAGNKWADHIAADLEVIFKHGWIDAEQLAGAKQNIARIPHNKRAELTKQLTDEYFDRDGYLHQGAKEMGLTLPG